jgi:hypothetical protein
LKLVDSIHLGKLLAILTNCLFMFRHGHWIYADGQRLPSVLCFVQSCYHLSCFFLFVLPLSLNINCKFPTSSWNMEQMVLPVTKNIWDSMRKTSLLVNTGTHDHVHPGLHQSKSFSPIYS